VFRLHELKGMFIADIQGAIIEHGSFVFSEQSRIKWLPGLHCSGGSLDIKGDFSIDSGLIDNTKIKIDNCNEFECKDSTLQNSVVSGWNGKCKIANTNFDNCTMEAGWETALFEDVKFNQTQLIWDQETKKKDFSHIILKDLEKFDRKSILSLKANATSIGDFDQSDRFFNIEMERQIQDKNEKRYPLAIAFILCIIFFINPSFPEVFYFQSYIVALLCFVAIFQCIRCSWTTFANLLYGYGHKPWNMAISIFIIVSGFAISWICNEIRNIIFAPCEFHFRRMLQLLADGYHYSITTMVTMGYWSDRIWPKSDNIMYLYSNIEALLGVLAMALLVTTVIRRTSGR
jgi:hypothetical protein